MSTRVRKIGKDEKRELRWNRLFWDVRLGSHRYSSNVRWGARLSGIDLFAMHAAYRRKKRGWR